MFSCEFYIADTKVYERLGQFVGNVSKSGKNELFSCVCGAGVEDEWGADDARPQRYCYPTASGPRH